MLALANKNAHILIAGLSEELKAFVAAEGFEVVKDHSIQLGYSHLNADQVLKVNARRAATSRL